MGASAAASWLHVCAHLPNTKWVKHNTLPPFFCACSPNLDAVCRHWRRLVLPLPRAALHTAHPPYRRTTSAEDEDEQLDALALACRRRCVTELRACPFRTERRCDLPVQLRWRKLER